MSRGRINVSPNQVEGSLGDTPLATLLASCREHLITGRIAVETDQQRGSIELRAGVVDRASFAGAEGEAAVAGMRALDDGLYQLSQRLPDLDGRLGDSATGEGELTPGSVVKLMRHCEDQALSCTITVVSDFDRAEIRYRAGEIVEVTWNGRSDLDAIVEVVALTTGRIRVAAPPLPDDIHGWPSPRKDPTVPFRIDDVTPLRRAASGSQPMPVPSPDPAVADAEAPAATEAEAPAATDAEAPAATEAEAEAKAEDRPKPAAGPRPGAFPWDAAVLAVIGIGVLVFWLVLLLWVR